MKISNGEKINNIYFISYTRDIGRDLRVGISGVFTFFLSLLLSLRCGLGSLSRVRLDISRKKLDKKEKYSYYVKIKQ